MMSADGYLLLGLAAWLGMILAPPAIARVFWKVARRRSQGWPIHLLFLPSVIVTMLGLAQIVFFAAHDDGEGPPGLGLALIPPFLVLLLTIGGYALCLVSVAVHALRQRSVR